MKNKIFCISSVVDDFFFFTGWMVINILGWHEQKKFHEEKSKIEFFSVRLLNWQVAPDKFPR
jgi:hypothetical protein